MYNIRRERKKKNRIRVRIYFIIFDVDPQSRVPR